MSDYTPSLAAIRQRWALHGSSGMENDRAEFDRAIAKIKADAVRDFLEHFDPSEMAPGRTGSYIVDVEEGRR